MENKQKYIDYYYKIYFDNQYDFAYWCNKAKSMFFDLAKLSYDVGKNIDAFTNFIKLHKDTIKLFDRISNFMVEMNKLRINVYRHMYHWTTLRRVKCECDEEMLTNICLSELPIKTILSHKKYSKYTRWFDLNFFRFANHRLDNKSKKLLDKYSFGDLIDKVYYSMVENDIQPKSFKALTPEERNEIFSSQCTSKEHETIRKLLWMDLSNEFFLRANTITSLLFNKINYCNLISNEKNFANIIEEKLFTYELNKNLFNVLSKSSQTFKATNIRFKNIEKALTMSHYHLNSFEPWDQDLNIFNSTFKINKSTFNSHIINALSPIGKQYAKQIKELFNNKTCPSIVTNENTQTSFIQTIDCKAHNIVISSGGTLIDLFKVSHEIGHFMNDYYVSLNNSKLNILQNEIAGLVNEVLMFLYLKDKVLIKHNFELCNAYYFFLKQMTNIVSLSNMRLVLKKELNNELERNNNETNISYEQTNVLFNRVKKNYEGLIDDEFRWIDNPDLSKLINLGLLQQAFEQYHLFDDIRYVIGAVVALNIAFDIYNNNQEQLEKFQEFLRAGCDISPIQAIKQLGFDLSNTVIYENASKNLDKLIAEFKHNLIGVK